VNASDRTARGVIDYKDPDAWMGHHDIAMSWPEMTALHAAATLAETTMFYAALDVSLRSVAICIIDQDGKVRLERSVPSDVPDVVRCLVSLVRRSTA
jgi:hypothetical protein